MAAPAFHVSPTQRAAGGRVKIGSLCTGYGGLDMALNGDTVWVSDIDPGAIKLLEHRYPHIPNLGDLTLIDWSILVGKAPDLVTTQRMYDLYCQGHSLAEVAAIHGVSRQTVYTRFKRQSLDLRQRPKPKPYVEFNGRKFTVGVNGYYRATEGDRGLLHRAVWESTKGRIPDGFDIHHIDHDKTNNDIANLECLSKADHARLYGLGCNQFKHGCKGGDATDSYAVDVLTAGYP